MKPAAIALEPGTDFGELRLVRVLATDERIRCFVATMKRADARPPVGPTAGTPGSLEQAPLSEDKATRLLQLTVIAPRNPSERRAILEQAHRHAGLDHPVLLGVRDAIEHQGLIGLVSDLPHGVPLSELLHEGEAMDLDEALVIIEPLVEGLAVAHRSGVTHGAVGPETVFVEDAAQGVTVRLAGLPGAIARASGAPAGPPGPTTDVRAVGRLLLAMLTGRTNLPDSDNATSILDEIMSDRPPEIADTLAACLAEDPTRVPADATTLADMLGLETAAAVQVEEPLVLDQGALQAAHLGRPWKGGPVSAATRSPTLTAPAPPTPADPSEWQDEEPTQPGRPPPRTSSPGPASEPAASARGMVDPAPTGQPRAGDMPAALAEVRARLAARDAARQRSGAGTRGPAAPRLLRSRPIVLALLLLVIALAAGGAWLYLHGAPARGRLAEATPPADGGPATELSTRTTPGGAERDQGTRHHDGKTSGRPWS